MLMVEVVCCVDVDGGGGWFVRVDLVDVVY